jgi:hypothetical protein
LTRGQLLHDDVELGNSNFSNIDFIVHSFFLLGSWWGGCRVCPW